MSQKTKIQWTDRTWNFLRGCSMVSEGCRHCYAMKQAHRFSGPGGAYEALTEIGPDGPRWNGQIRFVVEHINDPTHVKTPQRWFVNSMSDLFHEDVSFDWIDRAMAVMAQCPQHTFQILTKRPRLMFTYSEGMRELTGIERSLRIIRSMYAGHPANELVLSKLDRANVGQFPWPLPNVWFGVSVEDQKTADQRIPLLVQTPTAVRFVSYEPALERVQFDKWIKDLQWIIVGGESGHQARPFSSYWARKTVLACRAAGIPCFVKQLGSNYYGEPLLKVADSKGGEMDEWPEDLRVRQFPVFK